MNAFKSEIKTVDLDQVTQYEFCVWTHHGLRFEGLLHIVASSQRLVDALRKPIVWLQVSHRLFQCFPQSHFVVVLSRHRL
jgi:hypothetical protein